MKDTTKNCRNHCFTLSAALACTSTLIAGTETWFEPLTESAEVVPRSALEEFWAPWVMPDPDITQVNLLSLQEVGLDSEQSIVNHQIFYNFGSAYSASMIDMLAYDPTGNYLFIPHETVVGAGVSRHDISDRKTEILFHGDFEGFFSSPPDWSNDWGAFDPCRFTPNGTLLLGEEWWGQGRVMEVLNPFADLEVEDIEIRELDSIANVAHEGINFSKKFDDVIYFIDEYNSGSIYKFVMSEAGDYTKGQTFVLSVDGFVSSGGVAADNWDTIENSGAERTGPATWVPLTNAEGEALDHITDPFLNGYPAEHDDPAVFGGRPAADDAKATPYGRPEDTEVGRNRRQREVLYFTATSENTVYSVEMLPGKKNSKAFVRVFLNQDDTPKNQGFAPTTAVLNSPDNLAQDALGNIYVIEDAPNSDLIGGDIWFARDTDNDGVAESLDHFMSIRVAGCESTGMVFNPVNPTEFVMAVQHPSSTFLLDPDVDFGDAVWKFDISQIDNRNFLKKLEKAAKVYGHSHNDRD